VREYAENPARNASNADIAARFWKERDTVGEASYQRGLMLALRWHRIARDKHVDGGLDRLLHDLVRRGREEKLQLSNDVIRSSGGRLLGDWFPAEFDRYVLRAETIELPADALLPDFIGKSRPVYTLELGFQREPSLQQKRVVGLKAGSAAEKAGVREGDALAGWTIPTDADKEVVLRVRRAAKVETISYMPRGASRELVQFHPAKRDDRGKTRGNP
jgi:predicted metalloprotease with PDZ domain